MLSRWIMTATLWTTLGELGSHLIHGSFGVVEQENGRF